MGKTITTFLLGDDPKGMQYVFISNKVCQMYVIPRANLDAVAERKDLHKPAFYILLGEDDATMKPKAYIGETENFSKRIRNHDYKKPFWQKALAFISKDGDLTKSDVQYLEYSAIKLANEIQGFVLDENIQTPNEPNLPEYRRDQMMEFFDDVKFLTAFIGCGIFTKHEVKKDEHHLFYATRRGAKATGYYSNEGMVVLKGSILAPDVVKSFKGMSQRDKIVKAYTELKEGRPMMTSDKVFASPSTAACFCQGCSSNGWVDWKDEDGKTLDEVYRKNH